jgi:hypothetical protein
MDVLTRLAAGRARPISVRAVPQREGPAQRSQRRWVDWDDVGVDEHLIVRVSAKAVLLDMDGVLVDSTSIHHRSIHGW